MNTLKQKVVEIINNNPAPSGFRIQGHEIALWLDKLSDQILSLFSQSQTEQVRKIEKLKDRHYEGDDCKNCGINNCAFEEVCDSPRNQALSQVLSILRRE